MLSGGFVIETKDPSPNSDGIYAGKLENRYARKPESRLGF